MLSDTLVTNQVKDRTATEVEFQRMYNSGQAAFFKKVGESVGLEHRFTVKHSTTGEGVNRVRRSAISFWKEQENSDGEKVRCIATLSITFPQGLADDSDDLLDVLAHIGSLCFTTGTTLDLTGAGNGSAALINETL